MTGRAVWAEVPVGLQGDVQHVRISVTTEAPSTWIPSVHR